MPALIVAAPLGLVSAAVARIIFAAVGMAAGTGEYAMASVATGITLIVLAVLAPFESRLDRRSERDEHAQGGPVGP